MLHAIFFLLKYIHVYFFSSASPLYSSTPPLYIKTNQQQKKITNDSPLYTQAAFHTPLLPYCHLHNKMEAPVPEERGPGKNKRKWTEQEDAKLVAALIDMVNIGAYKAENGFKAGFLTYLEEILKVTLPNSGLKGKPHIESRIKTLKGNFNIVYDMLNSPHVSGFGWDPTTNCISAEKSVWDAYLQNRPKHAIWKNRSFPFYDDFLVIFGKDRATGMHAETPADVVSEMNDSQTNEDGKERRQDDDVFGDDVFANTSMPPGRNESNIRKSKKRSRSDDNLGIIKEAASIIGHEISKASLVFSKAIGVEAATADQRKQINAELMKIESLEPMDRIVVLTKIARDHELTDAFFSFNEDDREVMANGILDGKI